MNETKGHDPLCHAYGFGPGQRMDICICTGIRIGRADERDAARAEVAALRARVVEAGGRHPPHVDQQVSARCHWCGRFVPADTAPMVGLDPLDPGTWVCAWCHTRNPTTHPVCTACGRDLMTRPPREA